MRIKFATLKIATALLLLTGEALPARAAPMKEGMSSELMAEHGGGVFHMFRRAKLMFDDIDPALVDGANDVGNVLVGTIDLTDDRGGPRCARVRPPALVWSLAPA